MSFLKGLAQFFGFDQEPTTGQWPRKVESWEAPPERLPVVPPNLRPQLPFGIREVLGPDHQSWKPWSPPSAQRQNSLRNPEMQDFLRDGAVFPKSDKGRQ